MSWCRLGAMVLGECRDATVKLLWFSCCRLRLVPHGVAAELRGNRFSTEAGLLFGAGLGPPGWLWGAWSGTPFEVGLGLAEAAVESGRGHIAQDQLGTCQDDRGGGAVKRRTVRGWHFQSCCRTSPLWARKCPHQGWSAAAGRTSSLRIRKWLRRSVLGRPDS